MQLQNSAKVTTSGARLYMRSSAFQGRQEIYIGIIQVRTGTNKILCILYIVYSYFFQSKKMSDQRWMTYV